MAVIGAALPYIAAGLSAAGKISAGNQSAQELKLQGVVARQQAAADEQAQRRSNRQFNGESAAALAENGLTPTGSSGLLAEQNATLAELDALNIRYHGMLRGKGLDAESRDARRQGTMLAGQSLLNFAGNQYRPRPRTSGTFDSSQIAQDTAQMSAALGY